MQNFLLLQVLTYTIRHGLSRPRQLTYKVACNSLLGLRPSLTELPADTAAAEDFFADFGLVLVASFGANAGIDATRQWRRPSTTARRRNGGEATLGRVDSNCPIPGAMLSPRRIYAPTPRAGLECARADELMDTKTIPNYNEYCTRKKVGCAPRVGVSPSYFVGNVKPRAAPASLGLTVMARAVVWCRGFAPASRHSATAAIGSGAESVLAVNREQCELADADESEVDEVRS
ncbi:hypothetical protein H4582DRAFT_2078801 [Lactarius indigo]|nr:hypothetical protein H4582DRAFT_2078801 [Lactarius indigo]